ncbi:hypothetical protein E2320_006845, partial [Naja naja]
MTSENILSDIRMEKCFFHQPLAEIQRCICGMQLLEPKPQDQKQVTEGDHALLGTWPWLISIQIYTARGPRHSCDGAIIDTRWILTAAHCFSAKRDSLKSWKVVFGVRDLSRLPDTVQLRSIKRIIFHQDYNQFTVTNDIALIELDSPVNFDNYVQPICLPPVSVDPEAFSSCYISSWSSKGISSVVYEARAKILETTTCNGSSWIAESYSLFVQGNFEGLLTCKTSPKSPYYVVGISNFQMDCSKTKHPIIYTSVQQFVEWISTNMMGTESTLEEKHLQNRNNEDIKSASVTNPTKETIIMEPPHVPQETVPIILEAPYVPDEITPLPPVSPFIPREPSFVAVEKSFPLRPKSADRPEYHFPGTIVLPPQYIPPQAKVTLEPEFVPLETPAPLQPPYLPPESSVHIETPYIPPETTASLEPPYTLQQTTKSLESPYIPMESTASLEPPYTLQETTRSLEPPYIPLETTASLEPPYTLLEATSSLEPPYIPMESSVLLEGPYIPTEVSVTLEPSYMQLEIPPSLETSYTSSGISATLEPPYKSPQTPMPLEPSYSSPETLAPLKTLYLATETPIPLKP